MRALRKFVPLFRSRAWAASVLVVVAPSAGPVLRKSVATGPDDLTNDWPASNCMTPCSVAENAPPEVAIVGLPFAIVATVAEVVERTS